MPLMDLDQLLWTDDERVTYLCDSAEPHTDTQLVWTRCGRDVLLDCTRKLPATERGGVAVRLICDPLLGNTKRGKAQLRAKHVAAYMRLASCLKPVRESREPEERWVTELPATGNHLTCYHRSNNGSFPAFLTSEGETGEDEAAELREIPEAICLGLVDAGHSGLASIVVGKVTGKNQQDRPEPPPVRSPPH